MYAMEYLYFITREVGITQISCFPCVAETFSALFCCLENTISPQLLAWVKSWRVHSRLSAKYTRLQLSRQCTWPPHGAPECLLPPLGPWRHGPSFDVPYGFVDLSLPRHEAPARISNVLNFRLVVSGFAHWPLKFRKTVRAIFQPPLLIRKVISISYSHVY